MRTLAARLATLAVAAGTLGFGATINYVLNESYGSGAPMTALSAPNSAFSLKFSEGLPPVLSAHDSVSFTINVPVSYAFDSKTTTTSASIQFFDSFDGGLFTVDFMTAGNEYFWEFLGPQAFSGPTSAPAMLAGKFAIDGDDSGFQVNSGALSTLGSGSVNATIPEPGTVLLFSAGLTGFWAARRRCQRDKRRL